ncbi:hypothetical protein [Nocardia australiensis]|uniref:hypothetical protein n=1 Tax=Nocardia australiensis TaxID=2887191 RepID=UPI001D15698D|nr:hypothetical protein [Nocardia australiensis]
MAPQIPGMPEPPEPDPGQGAHGSQPWYSRGDDIAFAHIALAADAGGLTHASVHLRHYLDNSGTDLKIDPDQIMHDDPGLKRLVDQIMTVTLQDIAGDPASYSKSVPFQLLPWQGYTFDKNGQPDWYLAIGSIHVTTSGIVTVHPQDAAGAQPRVTVDYQIHLSDRYNWDGLKQTKIAGVKVTDARMGALHTAGLAQEFNMLGSSTIKHYEGVVPTNGAIDLPNGSDSRDGTRTDPGR